MTDRIRLSVRKRAEFFTSKGGKCALCDGKIAVGQPWHIDHIIALELGGADEEGNWQLVHDRCHRTKTKDDVRTIAKSNRIRARHMGIRKRPAFRGWRKFNGAVVYARDR